MRPDRISVTLDRPSAPSRRNRGSCGSILVNKCGPRCAYAHGRSHDPIDGNLAAIADHGRCVQERIEQELGENPVLEDSGKTSSSETDVDGDEMPAAVNEPLPDSEPSEFDSLNGIDDNWSELYDEGPRRSRASLSEESDRKQEAMQNMASRPRSFHDNLTDQLGFFDCEPIVRELAEYIIHNLDEMGLFKIEASGRRSRLQRPGDEGSSRGSARSCAEARPARRRRSRQPGVPAVTTDPGNSLP